MHTTTFSLILGEQMLPSRVYTCK